MGDSEEGTEKPASECDDNEEGADDDVYSNLPDFHYDKRFAELEESNATLTRKLEELYEETEKLKESNEKLSKKKNALSRNISVLYATAHAEMDHKNKLIEELRKERDSLIFRRLRQNNVHETVPYIPPAASSSQIPPSLCGPRTPPNEPQESGVLHNENFKKLVDFPRPEEDHDRSLSVNEYQKSKSESSSRSSSKHRSQDLSKDKNVKIDSSNSKTKITKKAKDNKNLIPLEITPQAKVEKKVSVSQMTKNVSKKSEVIENSSNKSESSKNTSRTPLSNNETKTPVPILPHGPEPTSSVEDTEVSSTPKENSRKVLNELLKQGLKMSPIKFDKEKKFRIPKRIQSTDLSSQCEPQLEGENVLENPGVMKSSETAQNMANLEDNKDNKSDDETDVDVTEKSESSVNISLPSVADCGSSRMRWTIVNDDSSDDSPSEPAEKKRKSCSSDDASTNKYLEKKGNRPKSAVLDYKNIEQIRLVNTSIKKKNDYKSPMKCNLRVEAVISERQKVINSVQRQSSPEGTKRRNQSRSRRSAHSKESSPYSPEKKQPGPHTDRKLSLSPRHDSYRSRCEDKYSRARRSPINENRRQQNSRRPAEPLRSHQRSSSREFHSRRKSRGRSDKYRDLDKQGSPDRRNRIESSDNSERRKRIGSPQKFSENELRETSQEKCRRPSRKRLHENSPTSPRRDNNKPKMEQQNSKQSYQSSTGKKSSRREPTSQKEKERPQNSYRQGRRQEEPSLTSHDSDRSEKKRGPDYLHMPVTHRSKFTSEAEDLREKLIDLRGKIGNSNKGHFDTGSESNNECVLYYTKDDLSFSEASDTESVKEKSTSLNSSVPLTEGNEGPTMQPTRNESGNVEMSKLNQANQGSHNVSSTSSSSSSSHKNSCSSDSDLKSDLEEGEISDD